MSDYVSMRSINLKNQIMMPAVLQAYRSGTLDIQDLQDTHSPLEEIYSKSYQYLNYPDLSEDAKNLISLVKPIDITRPSPNTNQVLAQVIAKQAVGKK